MKLGPQDTQTYVMEKSYISPVLKITFFFFFKSTNAGLPVLVEGKAKD